MTIESFDYIDSLDVENPKGSDKIAEGDNHIKGIKSTIKKTFPKVAGEVTATHAELSHTKGVTSPIQSQIDEGMADIANLQPRVDSLESMTAEHESEIGVLQAHGINDHPDVEFEGAPEDGDVMVFDGGKWRAKRPQAGNVMRMSVSQPKQCGDFNTNGWFRWDASWQNPSNSSGASHSFTFTNPQKGTLKFMLRNIRVSTVNGPDFDGAAMTIDGVAPYQGWGSDATVSLNNRPDNESGGYNRNVKVFPNADDSSSFTPIPDDNAPLIEVKDSIVIPLKGIPSQQYTNGRAYVVVEGWFVEDK